MKKGQYNLLTKGVKGYEYIIEDFIATKLSEKEFERLKELNPKLLGDYKFTAYKDTDFTWWCKVNKKLTKSKITTGCCFDIDYYGYVYEY